MRIASIQNKYSVSTAQWIRSVISFGWRALAQCRNWLVIFFERYYAIDDDDYYEMKMNIFTFN